MLFREDKKTAAHLSALGFGCMRFPRMVTGQTDRQKTERLIIKAVESGVNYYDAAYNYPGSEETLGDILKKNGLRDKVYIATKLPHGKCGEYDDFDILLDKQLKRLQTDHVDYYLIHNLTTLGAWQRLANLDIEKWIAAKKESGAIKRIGFSFHGPRVEFEAILNAYGWDFTQIQYNYLNPNDQAGVGGLHAAYAKGLPVIIMEPLLGGKLANLPKKAEAIFKQSDPNRSAAEWALRWLWDQLEPTVVLSGMNSLDQLRENVRVAGEASPGCLTDQEKAVFEPVRAAFAASHKVGCTNCGYCMPCPKGVNIPGCFNGYNLSFSASYLSGMQNYLTTAGFADPVNNSGARKCVRCGKCEKLCPQGIAIPDELKRVAKRLEPAWLSVAARFALRRRKKPANRSA